MSKSEMLRSSHYVDLDDSALKELLGFLWEDIKKTSEAMKNDVELDELAAKLKDLKAAKYGDHLKEAKQRLKAARAVASLRNIHWDVITE